MIIYIEWTTKKGKHRSICIATGPDKGACRPSVSAVGVPIFDGDSEGDVSIVFNGRKLSSNELAIKADLNGRYGQMGEMASELSFASGCDQNNIIKLSDIHIENSVTKERISIESIITILQNGEIEAEVVAECQCGR